MRRGKWEKTRYLSGRLAALLGLDLGRRIGLLDPTSRPTTSTRYDTGAWEARHRQLTVVDTYSAVVDLEHLKRGGVDVVFQAVSAEELFVDLQDATGLAPAGGESHIWRNLFTGPDLVERVRQGIDEHRLFVRQYRRHIELAGIAEEARRIVRRNKIAMVLMLKSGWIDDDLDVLRQYHRWGVRIMALCHLAPFTWADSSSAANPTPGLSPFGRQVVRECNQLGILVDLSHASDQTCWDALDATGKPLIATHSKCRALTRSPRDLSDDLMRAIAATGGVVGILAPAPRSGVEGQQARLARDRRLLEIYADPFELTAARLADAEVWGTKLDLDSIDHAVEVVGVDHVGLASHFQNVPQWKEFTGALREHGYSEEETEKILGGNALRVLAQSVG